MRTMWRSLLLCLVFVVSRKNHAISVGFKRSIVDSRDVFMFKLQSFCDVFKDLTPTQQDICNENIPLIGSVADGANLAKSECARQFKHERWNCSVAGKSTMLGRMKNVGTKEAAFNNALVCAGIIHVMARDCMKGILENCHCSLAKRPAKLGASYKWGGCGDNVEYGIEFSKRFLDDPSRDHLNDKSNRKTAGTILMDAHNNEIGRQAIVNHKQIICKCHGVTGNCGLQTCWYQVKNFETIGDYLKKKYSSALKAKVVRRRNGKRLGLKIKNADRSVSPKNELVYLEESPTYCRKKTRYHSVGTVGRECNGTSTDLGSCRKLCCDRGYKTERKVVVEKCECNFVWCCDVVCKTCRQVVDVHTCK